MSSDRFGTHEAESLNKINQIAITTSRIEALLESHVQNLPIHQLPPCNFHRNLTAKLWGVGTAAFGALFIQLISLIRDK